MAAACWTATALVALQAGHYVGKKADAINVYAELIADEWTTFLQDVYIPRDEQRDTASRQKRNENRSRKKR
ncbi:hypothetical protein ccbrp13_46580 [Ktedonobacteria bacterium brp13]|nr:hypothetical protein ccbrp13_46580 [Ktedonobacteria bacterium brp13]